MLMQNKDGLLYVEVQFDAKTERGNQTIHGEDEKTDYATVEFPMAASTHDKSENQKIKIAKLLQNFIFIYVQCFLKYLVLIMFHF